MQQAILAVHRVTRVFDPPRGGVQPGDAVAFDGDFAAWLRQHPRLRATGRKRVSLLGLEGVQLEVRARSAPPKQPEDCGKVAEPCVPLFHEGLDFVLYHGDARGRFTVLDLSDGGQLLIEQFAEPAGALQRVIKSQRRTLESLKPAR